MSKSQRQGPSWHNSVKDYAKANEDPSFAALRNAATGGPPRDRTPASRESEQLQRSINNINTRLIGIEDMIKQMHAMLGQLMLSPALHPVQVQRPQVCHPLRKFPDDDAPV